MLSLRIVFVKKCLQFGIFKFLRLTWAFFALQGKITTFESSKPTHRSVLRWDIVTVSFHKYTTAFTRVFLLIEQDKQYVAQMFFICLETRRLPHEKNITLTRNRLRINGVWKGTVIATQWHKRWDCEHTLLSSAIS